MDRGSVIKDFSPLGNSPRPNEHHQQTWLRGEYERLGGDYVVYRGAHLFPCGTMIEGLGVMPPRGSAYEIEQLRTLFWEIKVNNLEEKFNDMQKHFRANAVNGFSDSDRDQLLALKEAAELPKQKLIAARAELQKVMPYHLTEEGQAQAARDEQAREQRKSEALAKINSITF